MTNPAPPPEAPPPEAPRPELPRSEARRGNAAADLREDAMLRPRPDRPRTGWRRALYDITGGRVNPGPSDAEELRTGMLARVRAPLAGAHRVAVMSVKGGVGKTTVAACLGQALAEHRGDRAVVLDANPDAGTLADRLTGDSRITVRELLNDLEGVGTWTDVSRYTSLAGRL
ncbi:P-loop NTPase [Pseudonocardia sp. ICBG601]|uniref:nucleotide-binding protein n=1 Tax=Pseudonocardia sp. ICBG601 TaxID=2846759 RepID=UPI001CF64C8E|nr:P-loop NTPase [Pseudonocardia sp. ICBG601]